MPDRTSIDEQIWAMHRATPPRPLPSPPPRYSIINYEQLAEIYDPEADAQSDLLEPSWQHALSSFLTTCFTYKQPSFFEKRPPASLAIERQAYLAGATEVLCARFDLPVPAWVHDPDLVLPQLWDPNERIMCVFPMDHRLARAHPLFLRHNVLDEERNLICV
jgi:hypothetical protein